MKEIRTGNLSLPLLDYLYESVRILDINNFIHLQNIYSQGPLCDFPVFSMEGEHVNCHLVVLGSLSPYVLHLVQQTGGDCLILPDSSIVDIFSFMNIVYSGQ